MIIKKALLILILNLIGVSLLYTWYPGQTGFWFDLDRTTFYFFNELLVKSSAFAYLVAFTNLRIFDAVSFLCMLLVFFLYYRTLDKKQRRYMIFMGITMLITAIVIKQFSSFLDIERPSATKYFDKILGEKVNYVSEITSWPAKDYSSSCFPGDHGMFLLIFACFMFKYFGRKAFAIGLTIFIVFSLPRIMSGAHWFTDVAVGAVSFNLLVTVWMLLTPLSDWLIGRQVNLFERICKRTKS